ncbi:hypothetical protein ACFLZZ_03015 [Nanoarchaeota archaeon]
MDKGQLKIQEMAFVLLALAFLGSLVFIFVINFQSDNITSEAESLNQERALVLRDKIASLPELKCARINCIDKDKAEILGDYDLDDVFQGLVGARIVQLYPKGNEIVLYETNKPKTRDYPTFINLCEQQKIGSVFDYNCGLALLLVSI